MPGRPPQYDSIEYKKKTLTVHAFRKNGVYYKHQAKTDNTMPKFNTTNVMLLDEDIQIKQQNARVLMTEDIENAVGAAEDNHITLEYPCYADSVGDDTCDGIELTEDGIVFSFEFGWRYMKELDYEQLHTIYEAMRRQGCFKDED